MRHYLSFFISISIIGACSTKDVSYCLQVYPNSLDLIVGEISSVYSFTKGTSPQVRWSTSNPKVVSVDNNGNVFSHESGKAVVTACVNNEVDVCQITVKDRSTFWLQGLSHAYSDITWVDNYLVGFSSSDDSFTKAGFFEVLDYERGLYSKPSSVYRIYHLWGHCNTVDYNADSDCLIMGNGSGDYDLPGKIIIIPFFKSIVLSCTQTSPLTLEDVHALVIDCDCYQWGSKFNVVWAQSNGEDEDVAIVLSARLHGDRFSNGGGDMEVIRRIGLCKGDKKGEYGTITVNQTTYNGTFNLYETYFQKTDGYQNCNQGSCFHNDELYVAVGHDGFWYWRMVLNDGTVYKVTYKSTQQIRASSDGNASGVAIKDGYLFIGCANKGIMATRL